MWCGAEFIFRTLLEKHSIFSREESRQENPIFNFILGEVCTDDLLDTFTQSYLSLLNERGIQRGNCIASISLHCSLAEAPLSLVRTHIPCSLCHWMDLVNCLLLLHTPASSRSFPTSPSACSAGASLLLIIITSLLRLLTLNFRICLSELGSGSPSQFEDIVPRIAMCCQVEIVTSLIHG